MSDKLSITGMNGNSDEMSTSQESESISPDVNVQVALRALEVLETSAGLEAGDRLTEPQPSASSINPQLEEISEKAESGTMSDVLTSEEIPAIGERDFSAGESITTSISPVTPSEEVSTAVESKTDSQKTFRGAVDYQEPIEIDTQMLRTFFESSALTEDSPPREPYVKIPERKYQCGDCSAKTGVEFSSISSRKKSSSESDSLGAVDTSSDSKSTNTEILTELEIADSSTSVPDTRSTSEENSGNIETEEDSSLSVAEDVSSDSETKKVDVASEVTTVISDRTIEPASDVTPESGIKLKFLEIDMQHVTHTAEGILISSMSESSEYTEDIFTPLDPTFEDIMAAIETASSTHRSETSAGNLNVAKGKKCFIHSKFDENTTLPKSDDNLTAEYSVDPEDHKLYFTPITREFIAISKDQEFSINSQEVETLTNDENEENSYLVEAEELSTISNEMSKYIFVPIARERFLIVPEFEEFSSSTLEQIKTTAIEKNEKCDVSKTENLSTLSNCIKVSAAFASVKLPEALLFIPLTKTISNTETSSVLEIDDISSTECNVKFFSNLTSEKDRSEGTKVEEPSIVSELQSSMTLELVSLLCQMACSGAEPEDATYVSKCKLIFKTSESQTKSSDSRPGNICQTLENKKKCVPQVEGSADPKSEQTIVVSESEGECNVSRTTELSLTSEAEEISKSKETIAFETENFQIVSKSDPSDYLKFSTVSIVSKTVSPSNAKDSTSLKLGDIPVVPAGDSPSISTISEKSFTTEESEQPNGSSSMCDLVLSSDNYSTNLIVSDASRAQVAAKEEEDDKDKITPKCGSLEGEASLASDDRLEVSSPSIVLVDSEAEKKDRKTAFNLDVRNIAAALTLAYEQARFEKAITFGENFSSASLEDYSSDPRSKGTSTTEDSELIDINSDSISAVVSSTSLHSGDDFFSDTDRVLSYVAQTLGFETGESSEEDVTHHADSKTRRVSFHSSTRRPSTSHKVVDIYAPSTSKQCYSPWAPISEESAESGEASGEPISAAASAAQVVPERADNGTSTSDLVSSSGLLSADLQPSDTSMVLEHVAAILEAVKAEDENKKDRIIPRFLFRLDGDSLEVSPCSESNVFENCSPATHSPITAPLDAGRLTHSTSSAICSDLDAESG